MKQELVKRSSMKLAGLGLLLVTLLSACATPTPYDYTNYRAHQPRSILVLPPINESTDVRGTYSYLSTITQPVAEMGYYVYPVVLADQMLKENGLPTPGEMRQAPLRKLREVFGADAVLYITLTDYGTKFQLFSSATRVTAKAQLVDLKSETTIWDGTVSAYQDSGNNNNQGGLLGALVNAAVSQAINTSVDHARNVARIANVQFTDRHRGLLHGPYHPEFGVVKK
jgi:hypothetical protein